VGYQLDIQITFTSSHCVTR